MKVPVRFRQLDIGALPASGHISSTAYARLLLADALDAFVWLDVDIICREGWDEILDVDPEHLEIGFAACIEDPALAEDRLAALPNQAMSSAGSRYFNSGVLMIDGKRWRAASLPARWPEVVRNYRELGLPFHDQDVLNYLFSGHYDQLDSLFNAQSGSAGFAGAAARILHFKGALKPWQFPPSSRLDIEGPRGHWQPLPRLLDPRVGHAGRPREARRAACQDRLGGACQVGHAQSSGRHANPAASFEPLARRTRGTRSSMSSLPTIANQLIYAPPMHCAI